MYLLGVPVGWKYSYILRYTTTLYHADSRALRAGILALHTGLVLDMSRLVIIGRIFLLHNFQVFLLTVNIHTASNTMLHNSIEISEPSE